MSESPRAWTLSGAHWDEPVVIDGPRIDKVTIEVIEKAPVDAERERMLDLLRFAFHRRDEETHPEDSACACADCEMSRAISALLREHGRLSGEAEA